MKKPPNEKEKLEKLENIRFGGAVSCPYCSSPKVSGGICFGKDYHCNGCNRNFTLYTNTCLHGKKIAPLTLFDIVQFFANSSQGTSSREFARHNNINEETSAHILRLMRLNLPEDTTPFSGTVQADETYMGGKNKNRHWDKQVQGQQGRSLTNKSVILTLYETKSKKIKALLAESASEKVITDFICQNVSKQSTICTDEWRGYNGLIKAGYCHEVVKHKKNQYVNGRTTINGNENFHSRLKSMMSGVYRTVPIKNLPLFVKEAVFRYNIKDYKQRMDLILAALLTLDPAFKPYSAYRLLLSADKPCNLAIYRQLWYDYTSNQEAL